MDSDILPESSHGSNHLKQPKPAIHVLNPTATAPIELTLRIPEASFEDDITEQLFGDELHPNDADKEGGGRLRY